MEKPETLKLFEQSPYFSKKHKKYFQVYDELFASYKDKEITFVEIGIANGGSLHMWKNFFGKKARIIGIDLNPECKKFEKFGFEIFIGNQSKKIFWKNFFSQVGKVDVILDDGGHTNQQQILTAVNCIPNMNDRGLLLVEDVHSSYIDHYGNPSKYSFINFCKKTINDVNSTFPGLKNYNFSLKKYVYSIEFLESFVAFKIDRRRCELNEPIDNGKISFFHSDYKYKNTKIDNLKNRLRFLMKSKIIKFLITIFLSKFRYLYRITSNKLDIKNYIKYFK